MKKILLFVALATIGFSSCSRSEEIVENKQNDAISFGNSVVGTKAMEKTSTWVDGDMIGVHAFIKGGALAGDFEANFMNNEAVTFTTPNWAYTNTKYWPNNSTEMISFVAYYPISTMAGSSVTAAPSVLAGAVTIPFEVKANPAEQHDLLGGSIIDASKGFRDGASEPAVITGNTSIAMNHLLSKVMFTVKTNALYPGVTIRMKSVEVMDVKNIGNFVLASTFMNADWNTTASTVDFTAYTMPSPTGQIVTDTEAMLGTYDDNGLMMIPQILGATSKIVVNYEVIYTTPAMIVDETKEFDLNLAEWEINKMYTYKIGIGLDAITFDFDVNAWDTPGSDITI